MDMKEYSSSPDRGSFYRNVWKKQLDEGKTDLETYQQMMNILDESQKADEILDKKFNLEYDLRSNTEILNKARNSEVYSQNLYAALCNNRFFYNDHEWTCSWRYAGGIIADINKKGDYIDWYCSGIGNNTNGYVGEGFVTDEIRLDLLKLGWVVKPYDDIETLDKI
jgi:hypothetical protein